MKKDKWSFVKAAEVLGTYEMLFNVVNAITSLAQATLPYGIKETKNPYFKLALGLTGLKGFTGQGDNRCKTYESLL